MPATVGRTRRGRKQGLDQRPELVRYEAVSKVYDGTNRANDQVHQALPFYNMAVVIRAGLSMGLVSDLTQSVLVLGAWTVAGWAMTGWVIGRRR